VNNLNNRTVDLNYPLSFQEWKNLNNSVLPNEEISLYNAYILNWYNRKKQETTTYEVQLRLNYIQLLQQLQLFFTNEQTEVWFKQIDFSNKRELLLSIPYFAKKLKQIAIYYLQLREQVKKQKIKYNLAGTNTGIKQQLQEILLTLFTKKGGNNISVPSNLWSSIPDLSSINTSLAFEIEELYDDYEYYDKDPKITYNSKNSFLTTNNFLSTNNIPLSTTNWVYNIGKFNTSFFNENDVIESIELANSILEKYIGEDKYTSTLLFQSLSDNVDIFDVALEEGNNFFFWPSGPYKSVAVNQPRYVPILLNDIVPPNATGGETIENSDTIFIKSSNNKIEGAWLESKQYDIENKNIITYIENGEKTRFKFPFPGFGLSADDTPWSGPDFQYTAEFFYLDETLKQNIEQAYWSLDTSLTAVDPILLNETTLLRDGAFASSSYTLADKIRIWPDAPPFNETNYFGEIKEGWLFKFLKTDIPIASNSENTILWPYYRINRNEPLPDLIPKDILTTCNSALLTGMSLPYSTASDSLSTADIIYKLPNYSSSVLEALECAWLSGQTEILDTPWNLQIKKHNQPGLNIICKAGQYTKFIWEGPDLTDANEVFKTYKHQPDCAFTNQLSGSYLTPELCTCKMVRFTPFGHPGNNLNDYSILADFIAEDNLTLRQFDLNSWKDITNTSFRTSSAFGWYKTNNKIGWGAGTWYSGNRQTDRKFYLRTNRPYVYYRASIFDSDFEENEYPGLAVRYPYIQTNTIWIKAVKEEETNTWISTDTPSDMEIGPGNILVYSKTDQATYSVLSSLVVVRPLAENTGSIWSNYNYVSLVPDDLTGEIPLITVSYPPFTYANPDILNETDPYKQYPTVKITDFYNPVVDINPLNPLETLSQGNFRWQLTDPVGKTYDFFGTTIFSFFPNLTGEYRVAFAAITATSQGLVDISNVPVVTAFNKGSIWVDNDYASYDPFKIQTIPEVLIRWPLTNFTNVDILNEQDFYNQYPSVNRNNIVLTPQNNTPTIIWTITPPSVTTEQPEPLVFTNLGNTSTGLQLPFKLSTLGKYQITVTVMTAVNPSNPFQTISVTDPNTLQTIQVPTTGFYTFTNIPPITAENITTLNITTTTTVPVTGLYTFLNIPPISAVIATTTQESISTIPIPTPGFVLNVPLYGWNYNTNTLQTNAAGAKPFWAKGYTEKDIYTNFKGVESWGTPFLIYDDYNIITQPEFSDIILNTGNYIEYDRQYPSAFVWEQPTIIKKTVNRKVWNTLHFETTSVSNLSGILNNLNIELVTKPTSTPSNILLQNFINNEPVEVYYNAINPFTWTVTATPVIQKTAPPTDEIFTLAVKSNSPWENIFNRYYPTVAIFPNIENLYSKEDVGSIFTPNNLGISIYQNKNYTFTTSTTSEILTGLFEDYTKRIGGRGLTNTDQVSPFISIKDNNAWLKEPIIAGPIAGTIKKKITKKYQKFIPYQSTYETNTNKTIGLITPTSRQDPWDGQFDDIWGDTKNIPTDKTGVIDVEKWTNSQLLKQTNDLLDNWVTDIYGNQYGLYKPIKNVNRFDSQSIPGNLWIRTKNRNVQPAKNVLQDVFDVYKNTSIINDLTGNGILNIDVFYDTLYIQTTGVILFEKINYDLTNDYIYSIIDDARYISLIQPISTQLQREFSNLTGPFTYSVPGETWFIPENKIVYISVCSLSGEFILPEIYKLDLNTRDITNVFPVLSNDYNTFKELSSLNLTKIEPPKIYYNNLQKQMNVAILGKDNDNLDYLISLEIDTKQDFVIEDLTVYTPVTSIPSFVVPPYITQNLLLTALPGQSFTYTLTGIGDSILYTLQPESPTWITLSPTGIFSGSIPNTQTSDQYIPFIIQNSAGKAYYSLLINIQ